MNKKREIIISIILILIIILGLWIFEKIQNTIIKNENDLLVMGIENGEG